VVVIYDILSFLRNIALGRDVYFGINLTHFGVDLLDATESALLDLNMFSNNLSRHIFESVNLSLVNWHIAEKAAINHSC
jgi:hypothetical protein